MLKNACEVAISLREMKLRLAERDGYNGPYPPPLSGDFHAEKRGLACLRAIVPSGSISRLGFAASLGASQVLVAKEHSAGW